MPDQYKAIAFDLDASSLTSLVEAFPDWEIEVLNGFTAATLALDWNPGVADLLVVNARKDPAETLALCRFLVHCTASAADSRREMAASSEMDRGQECQMHRPDAAILVLVPSGQESLVRAVLEAGADSCLVLPIHAKEAASVLARVRRANQPGRHTLNLDPAQYEDSWQDEGGQG